MTARDPLCWYCYDEDPLCVELENCVVLEDEMNKSEAERYLRDRIALMDKRYTREYPKWTTSDYVAVRLLLQTSSKTEERQS